MVGIASAEVLNQKAQDGQKPEDNLPGARSVLSFGLRMLNSIFETPNIRVSRQNYVHLHKKLNDIAWDVAGFLEFKGFDAIPITSDVPVDMMNRGGIYGDISHRNVAAEAGLGQIGLSRNLLTPEFGPRVRLCSVITRAPLVCDKRTENHLCPEKCNKCIEACPGKALSVDRFDIKACLNVLHHYNLYGLLQHLGRILNAKDAEEKRKLVFDRTLSEIYMSLRSGDSPFCIDCVKVCPVGKHV